MRRQLFWVAGVIIAGAISVGAADQPAKPGWQKITIPSGEVLIFGKIVRSGYYALSDRGGTGVSLKQMVITAGIPDKSEDLVIQLRRHLGKDEARIIEMPMKSVLQDGVQDGDIRLEPNDTIQVFSGRAVR